MKKKLILLVISGIAVGIAGFFYVEKKKKEYEENEAEQAADDFFMGKDSEE